MRLQKGHLGKHRGCDEENAPRERKSRPPTQLLREQCGSERREGDPGVSVNPIDAQRPPACSQHSAVARKLRSPPATTTPCSVYPDARRCLRKAFERTRSRVRRQSARAVPCEHQGTRARMASSPSSPHFISSGGGSVRGRIRSGAAELMAVERAVVVAVSCPSLAPQREHAVEARRRGKCE